MRFDEVGLAGVVAILGREPQVRAGRSDDRTAVRLSSRPPALNRGMPSNMSSARDFEYTSEKIEIVLAGRVPTFYLTEDSAAVPEGIPAPAGLVSAVPGGLKFRTDIGYPRVRLAFQLVEERPVGFLEDYDDVVEYPYRSPTGEIVVLDWSKALVRDVTALPAGPGHYRLRYHVRPVNFETGSPDALVQLWPGEPSAGGELKITGSLGRFWHRRHDRRPVRPLISPSEDAHRPC